MAKQTQDREDLMREGTAMPLRGRLLIEGIEVVIGFRPAGQCSLYWNQDPVFQFDAQHQLRRAFVDSRRLKALDGRLAYLKRVESRDNADQGGVVSARPMLTRSDSAANSYHPGRNAAFYKS